MSTSSCSGGGESGSNGGGGGLRASVMDSLRGCGLVAEHIDKQDLKRKLSIPLYLCQAIVDCIRLKDPFAANNRIHDDEDNDTQDASEGPMVVFINPLSGGRSGPVLMERLQVLMGPLQVFDITSVKPNEFVEYGLGCLENMAAVGDICAEQTRCRIRVMVAGGVGQWVGYLDVLGNSMFKVGCQFLLLGSYPLAQAMICRGVSAGEDHFLFLGNLLLKDILAGP